MWRCWVLLVVVGCSKPVPGVCCLDAEDCAFIGVEDEQRACDVGLACVEHACVVPSCVLDGCGSEAPVCVVETDVCAGCSSSGDCVRFEEQEICDVDSGACVECLSDTDCGSAEPVCDSGACRGCKLDSECPSAACGDDGVCVDEAEIVYVAIDGVDTGTCPRSAPCKGLGFAIQQTSVARSHIVIGQGTYNAFFVRVDSSAPALFIHGGGSLLQDDSGEPLLSVTVPTTIRDLDVSNPFQSAIFASAPIVLERVNLRGRRGIESAADVTARDITVESNGTGAALDIKGGTLILDRATLHGGVHGVLATGTVSVDISNTIVFDTSGVALDLGASGVTGSVSFVTITDASGNNASASGIVCSFAKLQSSIVWVPEDTSKPPISGCNPQATIAGPVAVNGTTNVDPLFVSPVARDYHLRSNSPAIDAVDAGPSHDRDGQARPQGTSFDLGADEAVR